MEACHRPFVTESEVSEDFFQYGDSPVCASFGSKRGLDGVSRLEGCVLASFDVSGEPQVPQIHRVREGVPVQGSLLWAVHGSAGLHSGHGSGFVFSSPFRYSSLSLPRRLADPGVLSGAGSPCSGHSSPALSGSRDCRQLGEVSIGSYPMDCVSGGSSGLALFRSFGASPAQKRVEKLLSIGDIFLSCVEQPVSSWLEILGVLSSMIQLVLGSRLRMRSLQLVPRRSWDRCDQSVLV